MDAGGYENRQSMERAEDWDGNRAKAISHPAFWKRDGNRWICRTMFDEVPLPLDWPVYVSHAEANAYAEWAGKSLPTEAEWHRAAYCTQDGERTELSMGKRTADSRLGNFDFAAGSRRRSTRFLRDRAPSVFKTCWATAGSGLPRSSPRFADLSRSRFTADIRPIFSTASTSS